MSELKREPATGAATEIASNVRALCEKARTSARALAQVDDSTRSTALRAAAARLRSEHQAIQAENAKDLAAGEEAGLSAALLDRLRLDEARIEAMAEGLEIVAALPDPLGIEIERWVAPSGIDISQIRIPIGVIGVIYESRPNVTADVAALCVKSGNAVILKGGKEAFRSNEAIERLLVEELTKAGIPDGAVQLLRSTDRKATEELLRQDDLVDLLVPRGGPSLVRAIAQHSRIPVIKHYEGICHTYVDDDADLEMAASIVMNAKVQRPGVCNAMENLLVHREVASEFLGAIGPALKAAGVELRACERAAALLSGATPASDADWDTEYLDLILAVKIVDGVRDAVDFINTHGSGHSDAIVTANDSNAEVFLATVDSATVYRNASTRFTDGFAFGFGAEVGISTNRIHARGPMGLRELTTYKYMIRGDGQTR